MISVATSVTEEPLAGARAAPTVRTVSTLAEWERLEDAWRGLYAASANAAPPMSWDWLRNWWDVYGGEYGRVPDPLRIITVWRGDALIGALPLYAGLSTAGVRLRRLGFLSTGEREAEETCAEYLDLLHLPGEDRACLELMWGEVDGLVDEWEVLNLPGLAGNSALANLARRFRGWRYKTTENARAAFSADLSGGFDAYVKRLSSSTAKRARRFLRAVESEKLKLELASDDASITEFYGQLMTVHQARWATLGKAGCFAAPRFQEFHQRLARRWVPSGEAVLARLCDKGRPLAVVLGYVSRSQFHSYIIGTDVGEQPVVKSPGIALRLLLKRELVSRGVTRYNYMAGARQNKHEYADVEDALVDVQVTRRTPRTALEDARRLSRRLAGRVLRKVGVGAKRPYPEAQDNQRAEATPAESSE